MIFYVNQGKAEVSIISQSNFNIFVRPLILNISVKISGPSFQGLLVQARKKGTGEPVGYFSDFPADTRGTSCTSNDDSWTNSNKQTKQELTVMWNPPDGDVGDIEFL